MTGDPMQTIMLLFVSMAVFNLIVALWVVHVVCAMLSKATVHISEGISLTHKQLKLVDSGILRMEMWITTKKPDA